MKYSSTFISLFCSLFYQTTTQTAWTKSNFSQQCTFTWQMIHLQTFVKLLLINPNSLYLLCIFLKGDARSITKYEGGFASYQNICVFPVLVLNLLKFIWCHMHNLHYSLIVKSTMGEKVLHGGGGERDWLCVNNYYHPQTDYWRIICLIQLIRWIRQILKPPWEKWLHGTIRSFYWSLRHIVVSNKLRNL